MQDNPQQVENAQTHSSANSQGNSNGGAPLARLPWTTSASDESEQPWRGAEPPSDTFSVANGLSPEDIPGFPMPPDEEYLAPTTPVQSPQRHQSAPIRPLTGALKPVTAQGQNRQQGDQILAQIQTHMQAQAQVQTQTQPPLMFPTGHNTTLSPQGGSVITDQLVSSSLDPTLAHFNEPRTILETGINQGLISDLVLKAMYFTSYMSGQDISAMIRLPFYGVIDQVINLMKKEQLCEVSGTSGLGEAGYQYLLTVKGMERAHQVLARSSYIGPAPVPLARYIDAIKMQTSRKPPVHRATVEGALRGMVMGNDLMDQIGAVVNAGKSLFLFGAPGNGKTLLADRISTMLGGQLAIPYAIEADGQVIQLFDLNSHRPVVPPGVDESDSTRAELADRRWVRVHKPVVVVGGELTMASLDLIYNENAGFYEAPFQLKANGGLFLIDDFGRQQISPQALLNRWIVPLEKGIDYLTLKTGKKLQIPFELFLVLSTNLQPEDLMDDAFLRRIQNKLNIPDPTPQQFYDIFVAQCKSMNVPFDKNGFAYLVTKHYVDMQRPFRASQPRDLLRQLIGIARYRNVPPEMTPPLLDAACGTYFVNAKKK